MRSTLPREAMAGAHFMGQNAHAHPSAGTVPYGVGSSPKLGAAVARETLGRLRPNLDSGTPHNAKM